MLEIENGPGDPLTRLRQQGLAYVRFGLEHPNHYQVTFMMPQEFTKNA